MHMNLLFLSVTLHVVSYLIGSKPETRFKNTCTEVMPGASICFLGKYIHTYIYIYIYIYIYSLVGVTSFYTVLTYRALNK